jgi:lipopolysaccharide transport system permease protein
VSATASEKRVLEVTGGRGRVSLAGLHELWEFRHVFGGFVAREIKVRYKQTAIGVGWAFLQPIVAAGIFSLFLGRLAHVQSEGSPYLLFALAGTVCWTYFSGALNLAAQSIVNNQMLVRKIYFPREILPFYSVVASMVDLLPGILVLIVVAFFYDVTPTLAWLLIPLPLLIAILAAAGVGIIFSAVNVYYRDVRYALPFLLQIALFATPVVYSLQAVREPWRTIYGILNPMAASIDGLRHIVLHGQAPDWTLTLGALAWSLVVLLFGYTLFKRLERSFADRL